MAEDPTELVRRIFEDATTAHTRFAEAGLDRVKEAAAAISRALATGHKVLVFGNGGSAADSQHFASELVGRFEVERGGLPAFALTTDSSVVTSIANDYRLPAGLRAPGEGARCTSRCGLRNLDERPFPERRTWTRGGQSGGPSDGRPDGS